MKKNIKTFVILLLVIISNQSNHSYSQAWTTINPLPQENIIADMLIIPETERIIAIGNNSTIMISDDQGINWDIIDGPESMRIDLSLNAIEFVDSQTGYIIGSEGTLLKTIDGGFNWAMHYTFDDYWVSDIHIMDDEVILITTGAGNLYRSIDAGFSWSVQSISSNGLVQILFQNDSTAYILNKYGEIFRSDDSGLSWSNYSQLPGSNFCYFIYFTDAEIGYVGAQNCIFRTTDQGLSWEQISIDLNHCTDIIQVNTRLLIVGSKGAKGRIFYSPNNGLYWGEITLPEQVCDLKTVCSKNNILFAGGIIGEFIKSTDEGNTWNQLTTRLNVVEINEVDFTSETTGYAVGIILFPGSYKNHYGVVLKTTDRGENWVEVFFPTYESFSIDFIDDNTGFVGCESGRLYKTVDGGNNWIEIEQFNNHNTRIIDIHFVNSLKGFISYKFGNDGEIFITEDGGDTWLKVYSEQSEIYDFHFVNSIHGIAVGIGSYHSLYLETFDGGLTWENTNHVVDNRFNDICFVNGQTGFLAGTFGRVYKTTDEGTNWEEIQTPENYMSVNKIKFTNPLTGFLVGQGQQCNIYKTIDGGESWFECDNPPHSELNDIHFIDDNYGLVFGLFGIISKTESGGTSVIENIVVNNNTSLTNYPNPFSHNTTISFFCNSISHVEILIYNVQGNLIRKLTDKTYNKGKHSLIWDGTNEIGEIIESGVYLCSLKTNTINENHSIVFVK